SRANSIRMKNVPPCAFVVCWSECTMFAPACARKREVAATMPGRSGQEIVRRVIGGWGVGGEGVGGVVFLVAIAVVYTGAGLAACIRVAPTGCPGSPLPTTAGGADARIYLCYRNFDFSVPPPPSPRARSAWSGAKRSPADRVPCANA